MEIENLNLQYLCFEKNALTFEVFKILVWNFEYVLQYV